MSRQGVDWKYKYDESQKRIDELEQENARLKEQVEEQRGYAEHARKDRSEYGALADKFEAELAVVTSAAKASAKLLMQAEEEIENLARLNADRIVDAIFNLGDEPWCECTRIAFKGGEDINYETELGGICRDSLISFLERELGYKAKD